MMLASVWCRGGEPALVHNVPSSEELSCRERERQRIPNGDAKLLNENRHDNFYCMDITLLLVVMYGVKQKLVVVTIAC
jgi:hypothetical protein